MSDSNEPAQENISRVHEPRKPLYGLVKEPRCSLKGFGGNVAVANEIVYTINMAQTENPAQTYYIH